MFIISDAEGTLIIYHNQPSNAPMQPSHPDLVFKYIYSIMQISNRQQPQIASIPLYTSVKG
jgi:hypothetical protein